ncbi:non-ribosomal peptide synthetase, partial [Dactylosporangium darangshiense]|uniref:non-ribosomal peptide synthetase n=1 Tax=Dactylosporangium darangshiense TaxID=579108 RepID=UPI0031F0F39F
MGVGAESVVGLCLERGNDVVVSMLAVWLAGGAYLPLDPTYPTDRLAFMLTDSGATVLINHQSSRTPGGNGLPTVTLDDPITEAVLNAQPTIRPTIRVLPDQLAYLIYTSGTTGRPKAVQATHRGLTNLITAQRDAFNINHHSTALQFASISFDAAVSEITVALTTGATLIIATTTERTQPTHLTNLFQTHHITVATLPPSLLTTLNPTDITTPTTIISAGEALDPNLAHHWATHHHLINAYGPTETTVCATTATIPTSHTGPTPIGNPITNTTIHLLDRRLNPVPTGVTGEIHIAGTNLTRGYHHHPALTATTYIPDPFTTTGNRLYRTGDLARRHPNGTLEYLGRTDHQIKLRGHRIEPNEIQTALTTHPNITTAIVTTHNNRLIAYLIPTNSNLPTTNELRTHLSHTLPDHMIPTQYIQLTQLPTTPNGKLDRTALPNPDTHQPHHTNTTHTPLTPTQELLTNIWTELLHHHHITTTDDFFDLGGHSLLATQVIS